MNLIYTLENKICAKAFMLSVLYSICAHDLHAQVCSDPVNTIYGLSNSGNIVPITVGTAAVGATINPGYPGGSTSANAIGFSTANGTFYYFEVALNPATQKFVSFNPSTNLYTLLANSPATAAINRGCVTADGTGYYCLDKNGNLCYYNIAANIWTLISSTFFNQSGTNISSTFVTQGSGDMSVDGLGNLWIASSDAANYGLFELTAPLPTAAAASVTVTQVISPTTATPAGVGFAGMAFDVTGQIYLATPNDLYLLQNTTTLVHQGTFSVAGVGADMTSCNYPLTVLATTWENFTVSLLPDKDVLLNWTASEFLNVKGYSVEHSSDGTHWVDIGIGHQEADSDNGSAVYSFVDASPSIGENYYRIQQQDLNGNSSYSIIKAIDVETSGNMAIWPNPAKNIVNIRGNNNGVYAVNVQIYNELGQKVSTNPLQQGINAVNISTLPAGYYFVLIDLSNGEKYEQKLLKW